MKLFAVIFYSFSAFGAANLFVERLHEIFPRDIAVYLEQKRLCQQGNKKICQNQNADLHEIQKKYRGQKPVLNRLALVSQNIDEADEAFVWDDPKYTSKILKQYFEVEALKYIKEFQFQLARARKNQSDSDKLKSYYLLHYRQLTQIEENKKRLATKTASELSRLLEETKKLTTGFVPLTPENN